MLIVTKFSTGKVHIVKTIDSTKTLCGQSCKSNVVNDVNNGFGDIRNTEDILNVPIVTCKKCLGGS